MFGVVIGFLIGYFSVTLFFIIRDKVNERRDDKDGNL